MLRFQEVGVSLANTQRDDWIEDAVRDVVISLERIVPMIVETRVELWSMSRG